MKKLLALLFVCVGLTAMAVAPKHITSMNLPKANKGQMVMKANTLANQLTAGMQMSSKDIKTPGQLMKERKMIPSDNMLKRAPRRALRFSSDEEVANADYINYHYNLMVDYEGDSITECIDPFGGGTFMDQNQNYLHAFAIYDGQLYAYGLINDECTGYPLEVNIDYNTGVVSVPTGYLFENDTTVATKPESGKRYRYYTIRWAAVVDEAWLFNDDENAEFADVTGQMYDDGTIIMNQENGICYWGHETVKKYEIRGSNEIFVDSTYTPFIYINRGTEFLASNAVHEYEYDTQSGGTQRTSSFAYMLQYDDTTALVFNLYDEVWPNGVEMNIYPDGTMSYNMQLIGYISTGLRKSYQEHYDQSGTTYDFSNMSSVYFWGVDPDNNYEEYETEPFPGKVYPDSITWAAAQTYTYPIVQLSDNKNLGLVATYKNNVVKFTNGDQFLLTKADAPVFGEPVVGEEVVTFTATSEQEGATVHLYVLTVDEEGNVTNAEEVENPYDAERMEADYTIYLAAIATVEGMGASDPVSYSYVVPAYVAPYDGDLWILGEVNGRGWTPADGEKMTYDAENAVFKATVTCTAENWDDNLGANYSYFSFTKKLADNENDWDAIAGDRIGAVSDGDFLVIDDYLDFELSLTEGQNAFKIPSGFTYELTVSVDKMKLTIHKVPAESWMPGDVNHDGVVDVSDVTATISVALGGQPEIFFMEQGDLNGDGIIDVSDVTAVISRALGNN